MACALSGDVRIQKKGSTAPTTVGEALSGKKKYIILYFSALWCPSRHYTNIVRTFYNAHHEAKNFELIFVSLDKSAQSMQVYLEGAHGDWYYIPFEEAKAVSTEWMTRCRFSATPTALLLEYDALEKEYRLVTKCGRDMIMWDSDAKKFPWLSADMDMAAHHRELRRNILVAVMIAVAIGCYLVSTWFF